VLGGVHQTLCAGARQTELGLRELTLRVDHVNDTGIAMALQRIGSALAWRGSNCP
jgi:hypothetical protein